MGLLDDAIREHLDLKRRRGADPVEVARQEQDALGPPRMGRFAGETDDPAFADDGPPDDDTAEQPGAVAAGFGEGGDDEPWPDERHEAVLEDRREAVLEDRRDAAPEDRREAAPAERREAVLDDRRDDLDAPREQATSEFTPPGVDAPDETADGERRDDVLEETPDFLQETPEHDRLWFEQRPPRDFDFDK
jgi:hypothetical protein